MSDKIRSHCSNITYLIFNKHVSFVYDWKMKKVIPISFIIFAIKGLFYKDYDS